MRNKTWRGRWTGIVSLAGLLLIPFLIQHAKAQGEASPLQEDPSSAALQDGMLASADLAGFRPAGESEVVGFLTFAKRLTSGLMGPQTGVTNLSTFRGESPFQSETIISFLAYPLSEQGALAFDALADNPQSVLEALALAAQTSGNPALPRQLSELGGIGEKSAGFSVTLGREPVVQNIEFLWARRGTILQSTWVIVPVGATPSADLHALGVLVDHRIRERFPGMTFRQASLLVPEISTKIPTTLDISTQPGVIGTNLLLAALMMLPFTLAAEVFTRLSAEREQLLREKFWLTRWILNLAARIKAALAARFKPAGTRSTVLRLLLIMFFYGLAFSLLDRSWNPLSVTGLVLFLNMTVAYGLVGIADDIMQWRELKKWGKPAEINLRPTNIFIAAGSALTSRLLTLVPGLMFGTPEALVLEEARLGKKRRNQLLKISAFTFVGIGLGLWSLTTITALVQRQTIPDNLRAVVAGAEGFLLIVFAVALENTFVQMLGLPGSFGEALRNKSRWMWQLGLTGITFAFYHTLINPRGELSAAMQESNVLIFLVATGLFVLVTFSLWAYLRIKEGRPAGVQKRRKVNLKKMIPTWTWLAVVIIAGTVVTDILVTRRSQQQDLAGSTPTPGEVAANPADPATPIAGGSNPVELSFNTLPATIHKLCYLPATSVTGSAADKTAWAGVQMAAAQYGAQAVSLDPATTDEAGYSAAASRLLQENCDLIAGNYDPLGQVIMQLAGANPDQNFMLIDGGSDLPNVWVTKYSLPEEAYMAGYLAAAASRSGRVGTFGNPGIPGLFSGLNCFAMGVQGFNRTQQSNVSVLGWDVNSKQGLVAGSSVNPDQGVTLANDLISRGADVIFPMAGSGEGSTGSGSMLAAGQHTGVYVIGVGLDWAWAMPDFASRILSSAETRPDRSIAMAVDALASGDFHGGVHEGNFASGELALSPLGDFSKLISAKVHELMVKQSQPDVLRTEIAACLVIPHVSGFLNLHGVCGDNWLVNPRLSLRVYASPGGTSVFSREILSDAQGNFCQDVGVDLVPGMIVEVDDGTEAKSVTLVTLTVGSIDLVADNASGTAPAGAEIFIVTGDFDLPGKNYYKWVKADANGLWQASFAGEYDFTDKTGIQVSIMDANGNGTAIKMRVK